MENKPLQATTGYNACPTQDLVDIKKQGENLHTALVSGHCLTWFLWAVESFIHDALDTS